MEFGLDPTNTVACVLEQPRWKGSGRWGGSYACTFDSRARCRGATRASRMRLGAFLRRFSLLESKRGSRADLADAWGLGHKVRSVAVDPEHVSEGFQSGSRAKSFKWSWPRTIECPRGLGNKMK